MMVISNQLFASSRQYPIQNNKREPTKSPKPCIGGLHVQHDLENIHRTAETSHEALVIR